MHLARLVDYIHLNPVRAHLVPLDQLTQFRWSSYRWFARGPQERPGFLSSADWLSVHGELADSPEGWRIYHARLEWLMADDARQKEAAFERMSKGWVLGGEVYQRELLKDFRKMEPARDWGGSDVVELNRIHWRDLLERGSKALGESLARSHESPKSAPWKIALAAWIKRGSSVPNRWLSEQLGMGAPDGVSRYAGELKRGKRLEATKLLEQLTAKTRR